MLKERAAWVTVLGVCAASALQIAPAAAQLNEYCTVSILNRTAQVRPDGTWRIDNIPTGFGKVRARATCVQEGVTRAGQSEPFDISAGIVAGMKIQISFDAPVAIPTRLTISGEAELTRAGESSQLAVSATYADGSTRNVTAASLGTQYATTNAAIASVAAGGLVTAVRSGTVIIRATNEGTAGLFAITVKLGGDTDGDGIPDDIELLEGLNPNNAVDALEDADRDGLSNRAEFDRGTQIRNRDTDADTIGDGEEVIAGADGFITNPLLADTDGDGVRDALEISSGSDPTNPASRNLANALTAITVAPPAFVLTVNTVISEASRQLTVTGQLKDGTTIDLTSTARGTNYTSSDLSICSFGAEDGRVFAGSNGACTITAANSGFSAQSLGTVQSFTPTALSFVSIPGFANNVDVSGDYAYVAAGSAGLQIVSISNRSTPEVVAAIETPGNANDVVIAGTLAFVADGASGLRIIDVANPVAPVNVGAFDTPGVAWDVVVRGDRAYVADGAAGLQIIDISVPAAPRLLGAIDPPGIQKGVDVDPARNLAVLASSSSGLHVVDVANPAAPVLAASVSTGGDARDIALKDTFAVVADFSRSMTTVDLTTPTAPVVLASTPQATGGLLQDVTVAGRFAIGADVLFVNGVPIVDVETPATPIPRAILNFSTFRDDDGTGIAADGSFIYLTAALGSAFSENGVTGDSRLYIGQYLAREDRGGVAPSIQIAAPAAGATFVERGGIPVRVNAKDDVTVVSVSFLVGGQVVFTDTTAPYEFTLTAPAGASAVTLGATAIDLGGNVGTAVPVVVNVIPDPLTTVQGVVVNRTGATVAGATVTCLSLTGTSGADGRFTIIGVPTAFGSIQCVATVLSGGQTLTGSSARVPAVASGITDLGQIVMHDVTSRGRDFWLAYQNILSPGAQIVLTADAPTTWAINGPGISLTGTITPESPEVVFLSNGSQISSGHLIEQKGLHVTSEGDISAAMVFNANGATEMYLALPTLALGRDYLAVGYEDSLPARGFSGPSQFVVIATQDATNVTITPSCSSSGRVAGQPFTLVLNQGFTYEYQCANFTDVSGSSIVSDKPIAVIGGSVCADIPRGVAACNPLAEMLFPIETLYGQEFYSAPLVGSGSDLVRVMAAHDDTAVTIHQGTSQETITLNRGQFRDFDIDPGARYTSTKPMSVTQYAKGTNVSGFGDPFQMQLVPTHAWKESFRFFSPAGFNAYAIVTAPTAAVPSVRLNGAPVSGWQPLPGGTHQYAVVATGSGAQNIVIADGPIAVYAIGYAQFMSYGYPAGF